MSNKKKIGILTVMMAFALAVSLAFTSSAASGTLTKDQIDAIVSTETDTKQIESPFLSVANDVRESVVGVNNYQLVTSRRNSFGGFGGYYYSEPNQSREQLVGTGSGVVVSKYGHILTNNHVIKDAGRITVTFGTKEAEATLVASDETQDVAVLLVPGIDLNPVQLGDSDNIQVGEWAIVIGNPLGQEFDRSVTVGVVSAYDRSIQGSGNDRYGRKTTVTNSMIQVDAAISSGNSGGGMFNMLGQLQGIPTLKYDSSRTFSSVSIDNIGMCVPINTAKPLLRQALEQYNEETVQAAKVEDKSAGSADPNRPRIGITITTLSDSFNSTVPGGLPQGAYISAVESDSPAEKAGLQAGDIIVEVNETIVSSSTSLVEALSEYKEGDTVEVKYFRAPGLAAVVEGRAEIDSIKTGDYATTRAELKKLSDAL